MEPKKRLQVLLDGQEVFTAESADVSWKWDQPYRNEFYAGKTDLVRDGPWSFTLAATGFTKEETVQSLRNENERLKSKLTSFSKMRLEYESLKDELKKLSERKVS